MSALAGLVTTTVTAPVDMVKTNMVRPLLLLLSPQWHALCATRWDGCICGSCTTDLWWAGLGRAGVWQRAGTIAGPLTPTPVHVVPVCSVAVQFVNPQLYPTPTACVQKIVAQQVSLA